MHSVFICTTLVISVSSVFSQQPFVRYSESLKKVVPHHYSHDKENPHRSMDKVARGHKVEPRQPRLRPQPEVPWLQWVHKGRWAAQADRNSELHKVRARLLEEKLKPNQLVFKPHINPQLKPKLRPIENTRTKREAEYDEMEHKVKARDKRNVVMHQSYPEINRPPLMDTKTSQHTEQFGGRVKESEKRDKRQILYFINRPFQLMARSPRTTPNPFIRDTHIEEYDIIRPEVGEREGMIPTIETGSSDPGSYPLVNEESPEFFKIISQFYLTASEEYWPDIQQFADNILRPLSQLTVKKEELINALERVKENQRDKLQQDPIERYKTTLKESDGATRVKRRVNKTLKRKRAKKKKQRLRRFERKRLRMLTHARRVRRQQKAKQARLQRHYARMNMSTTETPDHLRNHTAAGDEDIENDTSRTEDSENDGDEEYESSEYEDESEDSKTSKSSDDSHHSGTSEVSDEDEAEDSETISNPDYGNDDYEDYDESDEDYEDESSEESKKKKKKIKSSGKGVGKRMQTVTNNKYSERKKHQRADINANPLKGANLGFPHKDDKVNYKHNHKLHEKDRLSNVNRHTLRSDLTQINKQNFRGNNLIHN